MPDESSKPVWTAEHRPSMFKGPAGSIKTLRRTYKDRFALPDVDTVLSELIGESDRSVVLLMTSLLDNALTVIIAKSLCFSPDENEIDAIFRFEGPLGSFSHKIEIAFLFGLIEDSTYQQLNIVREMRNACAHSNHPLTFSEEALVNVAKRLFHPLGFSPMPKDDDREHVKFSFVQEGLFLHGVLIHGSRQTAAKTMVEALALAVSRPPSPDKSP
jgi:mannitol operon repressor